MPRNRLKVAHTQGVIAKVTWEPVQNDSGYTGIYEHGATEVLLRFSQTGMVTEKTSGLHPSLALKFLRDGQPSSNIVAMPNFTGTDSWNFLENPMMNRVAPFDPVEHQCEENTIRKKLTEASMWPYVCSVSQIADWAPSLDAQGQTVDSAAISFPFHLIFDSPKKDSCLLYTSPSPRDRQKSRMPSSA